MKKLRFNRTAEQYAAACIAPCEVVQPNVLLHIFVAVHIAADRDENIVARERLQRGTVRQDIERCVIV